MGFSDYENMGPGDAPDLREFRVPKIFIVKSYRMLPRYASSFISKNTMGFFKWYSWVCDIRIKVLTFPENVRRDDSSECEKPVILRSMESKEW